MPSILQYLRVERTSYASSALLPNSMSSREAGWLLQSLALRVVLMILVIKSLSELSLCGGTGRDLAAAGRAENRKIQGPTPTHTHTLPILVMHHHTSSMKCADSNFSA